MAPELNIHKSLIKCWQTNNQVTMYLIKNLPKDLWNMKIPGQNRKTVGMIAAHIHNARCMWIKMLGKNDRVAIPESVDRYKITPRQLISALKNSGLAMTDLFKSGIANGGKLKSAPYQNFPPDIVNLLAYFTTHEGHHRGQIVMIARQLGFRLTEDVTMGLWQWTKRSREAGLS